HIDKRIAADDTRLVRMRREPQTAARGYEQRRRFDLPAAGVRVAVRARLQVRAGALGEQLGYGAAVALDARIHALDELADGSLRCRARRGRAAAGDEPGEADGTRGQRHTTYTRERHRRHIEPWRGWAQGSRASGPARTPVFWRVRAPMASCECL